MILALAALALAEPTAGQGSQALVVLMKGVGSGVTIEAERAGVGTITLQDPGIGLLRGRFYGEPARFAQLKLTAVSGENRRPIYDALVIVGDAEEEILAFAYSDDGAARRIPVAPSARVDVALDPATAQRVAFGWAAIGLGWVAITGIVWACRRR